MRKHRTDIGKRGGRLYPTLGHWIVDMSHEELVADMASRGETVEGVSAAFDKIHALAAARLRLREAMARIEASEPLARQPSAAAPALAATAVRPEIVEGLAFHEEPACAGRGLGDADSGLRRATLSDLFGKQDWGSVVAVRVSGPSMEGDHINDGDTVLVDVRRPARDGDIVLVHLAGHGQLVKRFRLAGPFDVSLESANPDFDPIAVDDPANLTIHGVVVGRSGKV